MNVTVERDGPRYIEARRSPHGRCMRIAYEAVGVELTRGLTRGLLSCSLQEELRYEDFRSSAEHRPSTKDSDEGSCARMNKARIRKDGEMNIGTYPSSPSTRKGIKTTS